MNKNLFGGILLLVGSVGMGAASGDLFFKLFLKTVPPALLTSFNRGAAHGAFIIYGLVLGVVVFVWALVAILLSPLFKGGKKSAAVNPSPR